MIEIITQHKTCIRKTSMLVFNVAVAIDVAVAIAIAVAIAVAVTIAIVHRSALRLLLLLLATVPEKSQHLQLSKPKS